MSHTKADTKKGKHKATTKDSTVGVRETSLTDPLKQMLEGNGNLLGPDVLSMANKIIYQILTLYMEAGGYPTEANPDFKEAYIHDLAGCIIYPMVALFKRETKRKLRVSREKEIISKDSSTSGMEEFVIMDIISYNRKKFVLVAEAKKVSLGEARKQCFLSLKDMWDYNGGGTVYGFVTMGDMWRMVSFDGNFQMSEPVLLMFDSMGKSEERWMAHYSILVDCLTLH
ncbi:hypothetical protein HOY82DRAFT_609505 [Tuber indicum]|nr:hypothetical protein HOY82DRAFT_609505 [Tuber indicum]